MLGDPFASVAARESQELLGQEELCYRRALLHKSSPGCVREGGRERDRCVFASVGVNHTNKQTNKNTSRREFSSWLKRLSHLLWEEVCEVVWSLVHSSC